MYCHFPFLCKENDSKIVHATVQYAETFTPVCSFIVQLAAMDSSQKRKLIATGTTPKKAEKLRKKKGKVVALLRDHHSGPHWALKESACSHHKMFARQKLKDLE